ncbi:dolichyl-diphosphooligosaccharide--protein glycosyltransferase [Methanomicrobium sp. W14]|uniref:oligosaccharyl transferase, archaeosortase A system-associated n=1 Tax=Methanomicrobium sp. W14 TaxID=2817839 RepID=UPI001AE4E0B0|nr:oligosaccharyl transferase, archaeosortase A system-associated [Methanomicrobium sp. W14]MBP2134428.1 dolichyl-diphosphooligosaccharide--protein glycosyltransferase [Methanomicrobium sp. W14]
MSEILKKNINIFLILIVFAFIAFILRVLPAFFLPDTGLVHLIRGDAEYNLRQIEVMADNFLQYDWFDPMTAYPYGKNIGWGPLFPMIAGAFVILTGASGQAGIINAASYVTPLIAAAMVFVVYFTAKAITGKRLTGIIAAAITPFISLFFLNYTSYGYVDHHAAELLFSSLFCLFYILASGISLNGKITDLKDKDLQKLLLYSVAAGIFYSACYFTSPTTVLFLVIISVYTLISCILCHYSGEIPVKEGIINTISLLIPAVLIALFGVKYPGFTLSSYTIVHALIPILIIAATWILVLISAALNKSGLKEKKIFYPVIIVGAAAVSAVIAIIAVPEVFTTLFSGANLIFGFKNVAIAEMKPWSLEYALQSYNFAFILAAGGFLASLYTIYSEKDRKNLFLIIWTITVLYVTIRHLRFEIFVAIPFAVLSAICISYVYKNYYSSFKGYIDNKDEKNAAAKSKKKPAKKQGRKENRNASGAAVFLITAVIVALFFGTSLINDINFAQDYSSVSFEKDKWTEAMNWMNENTPETGVDYYKEYSADNFTYPKESYGVMTWWDFGHIITLIGKRIPNSNPFQDNVAGDTGCADFFISGSEDTGSEILDNAGSRFVVTNSELTTPVKGIATILPWTSGNRVLSDYIMYAVDESGNYQSYVYTPEYYNTMAVRLENLDGSYTKASSEKSDVSYSPFSPPVGVNALKHFRLVYESPDSDDNVKIFEYVKGYEVAGEGTVELNITTNTGREFVYRQKSENGTFILPYSTTGNPYDVKADGQYHITGTGEYFDVSEDEIGKN